MVKSTTKTFKDLKINDEVFIISKDGIKIIAVERKTKTQIIVKNGNKYRISDGYKVGVDSWNKTHIKLASASELQEQKEKEYMLELTKKLHNFKGYGKFSIKKLEKICEIIELELPKRRN